VGFEQHRDYTATSADGFERYPQLQLESIESNLANAFALRIGCFTNSDLAQSKLEELADKGSIASMGYLGDAYSSGRFFVKALDKAKMWFLRAEASGWRPASYRAGRTYYMLNDYDSAFRAFSRGTDYVPAIYRLAIMYEEGLGTTKDLRVCPGTLFWIAKLSEHEAD
jgi:TPR repeat protein